MKEYFASDIYVGIIEINNEKRYLPLTKERSNLYYDIINHTYYGGPRTSLRLGSGKLDSVVSITKYHTCKNNVITMDEILSVLYSLNRSNIKTISDDKRVVTGIGEYRFKIEDLYVGVLEKSGIKKHLALFKENDVLYRDAFNSIYYGGPTSSLKLGKGTLSSVTKMTEYVKSQNGLISYDEVEDILSTLNKTMNTNINDIVLSNISYLYDFIIKSGFSKSETEKLIRELYDILISYEEEINEYKYDDEDNSNSLSPIKQKYMDKLINFDERLKDYINYEDNFEYQVDTIKRKISLGGENSVK